MFQGIISQVIKTEIFCHSFQYTDKKTIRDALQHIKIYTIFKTQKNILELILKQTMKQKHRNRQC